MANLKGCGRKIGPYDCCTVVCGDCLVLMRDLPDGCVDAVITDPPYGIGIAANSFRQKFTAEHWDDAPANDSHIRELRRVSRHQIIWGGNYFNLPPSQGFLVWDKFQSKDFSSAMCEQAWTDQAMPAKLFRRHAASFEKFHPTTKPEDLIAWCFSWLPDAETILDPFLGSGTTAVVAKKLGRHFLGFEIEQKYVDVANERIALVEAQSNLFEPKPKQLEFVGASGN